LDSTGRGVCGGAIILKPMGRVPGTGVAANKKWAGEVKKSLASFHPPIKK
jgi:hypothetical protein